MTRIIASLVPMCLARIGAVSADEPVSSRINRHATIVTGSVGVTSDYVFRGLSLTRGKLAAQGSVDVEFPHEFYLGGFISNVDLNPRRTPALEFDVWAGKYWRLMDDLSLDLRLSQYTYPNDPRRWNYNRTELTTTLGYRNRFFLSAIYSPNTYVPSPPPATEEEGAWAVEISANHAWNEHWSLAAGAGHYQFEGAFPRAYQYFNATVIARFQPFEFQLAWLGTDHGADGNLPYEVAGKRVAFTALWRFSTSP